MTYTGHRKTKMPDGQTLVEWITPTVVDECHIYGVDMPTQKQMAVVVSALRMHTIMMHAAGYDTSVLGKPEQKDTLWPMQGSIGKYFRDAARETLDN